MDNALTCPFFYIKGCKWRSAVTQMAKHFICIHRTAYQPHPITVELVGGTLYPFVTVAFNTIFFVQIKVNLSLNIECQVKCLHLYDKHEFHFYEYRIRTEDDNDTFINLLGEMQSFYYPNQTQFFEFGHRNTQNVKCKIEIYKRIDEIEIAMKYNVRLVQNTLNLKQEFEMQDDCIVPTNKLKNFGLKLNVRPSSKVTDAQNYSLENLIESLQYPCQFTPFGCQQILNCQTVIQHLEECLFKPIRCPFKFCRRNIIRLDLSDHCERVHAALLCKEHQVLKKVLTVPNVTFNRTIFDNEVFLLRLKCEGETNSVQLDCVHVNEAETRKRYAFELQFLSEANTNQKLGVSHSCKDILRDVEDDPVVIPLQLLKPFISKNPEPTLYYKCWIKNV